MRKLSKVNKASAAHTIKNPVSSTGDMCSFIRKMPRKNWILGVRYCSRPIVDSGIRIAAPLNGQAGDGIDICNLLDHSVTGKRESQDERNPWQSAIAERGHHYSNDGEANSDPLQSSEFLAKKDRSNHDEYEWVDEVTQCTFHDVLVGNRLDVHAPIDAD